MYVDLAGLARYKSDFDAWARGNLLPKDAAAARVRTAKAGAVSFVPVQETPLDVSVDFLFTETPPASGDKGPSNPSTISGVSSVNVGRIGKNLLLQATGTPSGYTIVRNDDGSLSISGSGAALFAVTDSGPVTGGPYSSYRLNLNKQYTLSVELVSGSINNASINLAQSSATQRVVSIPASGKASTTFTPSAVGYVDGRFVCRMMLGSSSVATNAVLKIQLEEGSTATDFEAPMLPADANHVLPLGSTYYGGTLDIASGVMTVTWYGTKLTSASSFRGPFDIAQSGSNKRYIANLPYGAAPYTATNQACTHYNYSHLFDDNIQQVWVSANGTCYIYDSFTTLAELNAFLDSQNTNGTPVVICYQLATPFTVTLTSTEILSLTQSSDYDPRVNTVYSDAQAVQVGYLKHPSAASSDLRNAVVSLGGGV